jgi:D-glycero-D-manno-heptose 1,7-bisphosphate phosphatase
MKLVILDRDGTINEDSAEFVKSAEEWVPLPGALEAIARLNHAGWHVVVASNQSGLGRGLFDVSALNDIHAKMHKLLAAVGGRVDAVFYCPHAPDERCRCRKPEPGLFEQIGERYGIDLYLVLTGKGAVYRGRSLPDTFPLGTLVHADLAAFADFLIAREAVAA